MVLAFYITYEELKLIPYVKYRCSITLFILPMRNWNRFTCHLRITPSFFLYYLWGIETILLIIHLCQSLLLFILPMRNWNLVCIWQPNAQLVSFYITYEELKHVLFLIDGLTRKTFYITYEELKLPKITAPSQKIPASFYITYEELKHGVTGAPQACQKLFILPMRNWNFTTSILIISLIPFLYYLWGIETKFSSSSMFLSTSAFYITYEELKHAKHLYILWTSKTFYITYEELKRVF